jgi:hypothetical protein
MRQRFCVTPAHNAFAKSAPFSVNSYKDCKPDADQSGCILQKQG